VTLAPLLAVDSRGSVSRGADAVGSAPRRSDPLRAPFPWFGGKRRVADIVWRAFGPDVANYVEPFAGSLAVLLARPGGAGKIETVNDRDAFVANFWRAVHADPEAVARWADWPVNEADLHARHAWLVSELETHRARMHSDADYYDEKIAGWWVWGLCQWIGGGWCVEPNNQKHPKLDGIGKGVHADQARRGRRGCEAEWKKRPELDGTSPGRGVHSDVAHLSQQLPELRVNRGAGGRGVHASGRESARVGVQSMQRPYLPGDDAGRGVHGSGWNARPCLGRRPDLSSAGQGVHLPSLGNDRGLNSLEAIPCLEWFHELCVRLRRVRVACGDWSRVLGPSVLGKGKNVGGRRPCAVFLDPPYSHELRDAWLYAEDDERLSTRVWEWALEHGDDPDLRIALCGYAGEHEMPASWACHAWKAARGYAGETNDNRELERIWFSPHCLPIDSQQSLFGAEW
jgi:hypothetical protein